MMEDSEMKKVFKNISKILLTEQGVTLVELLVYVGSLGGLAFIIASLGINMNKATVVREADLRAAEFMQEIQLKVSKSGACNENFAGHTYTTPASFYSDPINEIRDAEGNAIYTVGDELDNYFTISNMRLDKINATRSDVSITLTRRNTKSNAISTITRKLKLTVEHEPADATTIKTCMVSFDQLTGDQLPLLCNGEGSILSDEGTPADETDDICIHAGYSVEQCPVGEYVQRFELVNIDDGSGNLQPYYRPVCVAVDKPRSLSCPAGEVLKGYTADDGLSCRPLTISDIYAHFLGDYTDCSATQQFPIQMVGSAININCGAALPPPPPTDTPTPTPTPTAGGNCYTITDRKFVMKINISGTLSSPGSSTALKISAMGTDRLGNPYQLWVYYWGSGTKSCFTDLPCMSVDHSTFNSPHTNENAQTVYFTRSGGVISSNDPVNYPNNFYWGITDVISSAGPAVCTILDAAGNATIPLSMCATIHDVGNQGWSGLERPVTPITVCIDDSSEPGAPVYNHADPYDYWTVP